MQLHTSLTTALDRTRLACTKYPHNNIKTENLYVLDNIYVSHYTQNNKKQTVVMLYSKSWKDNSS